MQLEILILYLRNADLYTLRLVCKKFCDIIDIKSLKLLDNFYIPYNKHMFSIKAPHILEKLNLPYGKFYRKQHPNTNNYLPIKELFSSHDAKLTILLHNNRQFILKLNKKSAVVSFVVDFFIKFDGLYLKYKRHINISSLGTQYDFDFQLSFTVSKDETPYNDFIENLVQILKQ